LLNKKEFQTETTAGQNKIVVTKDQINNHKQNQTEFLCWVQLRLNFYIILANPNPDSTYLQIANNPGTNEKIKMVIRTSESINLWYHGIHDFLKKLANRLYY
jgi:hypothetical protein